MLQSSADVELGPTPTRPQTAPRAARTPGGRGSGQGRAGRAMPVCSAPAPQHLAAFWREVGGGGLSNVPRLPARIAHPLGTRGGKEG